jgi:hypothetical protein
MELQESKAALRMENGISINDLYTILRSRETPSQQSAHAVSSCSPAAFMPPQPDRFQPPQESRAQQQCVTPHSA